MAAILGHVALCLWFVPRGRVKILPLHWQLNFFVSDMLSGTGDPCLHRTVRHLSHYMVHPGEEKHSFQPAHSSGSGSSNRVVTSSSGV